MYILQWLIMNNNNKYVPRLFVCLPPSRDPDIKIDTLRSTAWNNKKEDRLPLISLAQAMIVDGYYYPASVISYQIFQQDQTDQCACCDLCYVSLCSHDPFIASHVWQSVVSEVKSAHVARGIGELILWKWQLHFYKFIDSFSLKASRAS